MNTNIRKLSEAEILLLSVMIDASEEKWSYLKSLISSADVYDMNDGGMGSLKFIIEDEDGRQFGETICEAEFIDTDGITVSIVLNVDQQNRLYELDVWKVNFSQVLTFPEEIKCSSF